MSYLCIFFLRVSKKNCTFALAKVLNENFTEEYGYFDYSASVQ